MLRRGMKGADVFQSTPPARGATAPPPRLSPVKKFQSTPPARGATQLLAVVGDLVEFQSTPPARGATVVSVKAELDVDISIHAPREGGDVKIQHGRLPPIFISIHAPREGGDSKDAQFYLRIFDK